MKKNILISLLILVLLLIFPLYQLFHAYRSFGSALDPKLAFDYIYYGMQGKVHRGQVYCDYLQNDPRLSPQACILRFRTSKGTYVLQDVSQLIRTDLSDAEVIIFGPGKTFSKTQDTNEVVGLIEIEKLFELYKN